MANEKRYVLNGMFYENNKLCASIHVFCSNRMNSPCGQALCKDAGYM